jgi:K+ transporter
MQQELARHYQTNFHTEKRLLSIAVKRWFWKTQGLQYAYLFLVLISLLFFVLKISLIRHNDSFIFAVGFLSASLCMMLVYIIGIWNNIKNQIKKIPSIETTIHLTDEQMEVITQEASSRVKWEYFSEIWIFPDVTLLFWKNSIGVFNSIPTQAMSEEMQAFLIEKVKANGGKVVR